ncbi:MAG TPA: hypothetical protein VFH29_07385, partial [Anaerolineales bacterium]|nr:hypothetical protein [Anaerolineales bacterium]
MSEPRSINPPRHPSYRAHRRQFWTQIMLPVLLAFVLFIIAPVAIWLGRMSGTGDVGRWAEISSM